MRRLFAAILSIIIALSGTYAIAENIEVEENLFSVEITIPADFAGEDNSQESWDTTVAEGKCKSATVNEDGSVTIVMSKKQHNDMLEDLKLQIDAGLVEMVETSEGAAFVSIEANEDCTEFKAILSTDYVGMVETLSTFALFLYGGMYNAFAGTTVENVTVTFINQATGEVIETYNSAEMEF